jgi:hypothetical protein
MKDLFLKVDLIATKEQALTWSINAALQRNKVYKSEENFEIREHFRNEWGKHLIDESGPYREPARLVSDEQHCAVISKISEQLSSKFGQYLDGGRLRFGTSQKAFNLYLKYLWALGEIAMPPHCPVDSVVLKKLASSIRGRNAIAANNTWAG